jgi:hypothetical protein
MEAPDEQTVRFRLHAPDAFLPNRLAQTQAYVVSPEAHRPRGKDLARNPAGTGPFRFARWIPNREVVVERFTGYWGAKANLDRVVVRPVPEAGARVIALEAGDIQLAIRIPPEQVGRVERNPALRLASKASLRTLFIGMHAQKKPWSDRRHRAQELLVQDPPTGRAGGHADGGGGLRAREPGNRCGLRRRQSPPPRVGRGRGSSGTGARSSAGSSSGPTWRWRCSAAGWRPTTRRRGGSSTASSRRARRTRSAWTSWAATC